MPIDDLRPADSAELERDPHPAEPRSAPAGRHARADAAEPGASARPRRGWKQVLVRVYQGIDEDRILANAAGVTFYALLALFPAIAALVSIYALFADPSSIAQHLDTARGVLPGGALDVIRDQLNRLAAKGREALGISFAISLVISLWSANGGIKGMFDALNMVYEEKERRGFIRLNLVSLAFTAAGIGFAIVALVGIVAVPIVLGYLPGFAAAVIDYCRWPVLLVVVALALAVLYRFGPSREQPRWRWIGWGNVFAAAAWLGVSALFSWYASNFGSFNKTYGSLGAVIGFMIWMWLSASVVLIGGKINAETER